MVKRYYFYSANLHSNEKLPSEITGYVSGIMDFKTLLPLNPIKLKHNAEEIICSACVNLKSSGIHFLKLERFKS